MDLGLTGKRALVLASSRGLGLGIAEAIAAEGADVLITGRDGARLQAAVEAINAHGAGTARFVVSDLTDKTTPALLMAAATVNIPAIALSVGPMLNGWWKGERAGSGTVIWKAREDLAAGEIDTDEFMEIAAASAPSVGYCNTMGTATTMNSLAEALGMQLPGSAAIPAQSPTLSPTLSALVAGFRGSSSGIPASTFPTRSAPTSAALVKMPPPTRANKACALAPIPKGRMVCEMSSMAFRPCRASEALK